MNIIANNVVAKLTVAFVAAAMIFTFATPAKAQTMEDLQAQIAALMAQIAALTGSTDAGAGAAACTFTRALTVGSQGADVNCLQNYLTSTGHFNFSGGSTGYFGSVTQSAVAAWQGANGVAPAAGYFGPVSQARYSALVAAMPTTPTTPGTGDSETPTTPGTTLQGGEGDISVEETFVFDGDIELGASESVIEFEVEALDSDISINRVDVFFSGEDGDEDPISARPWLYFSEVNLLVDGEEVASLSSSSHFTEVTVDGDDYWRARFGGLNIVIREDDIAELSVEVVVRNSMTGDREEHTIFVDMFNNSIRFVDGMGISETGGAEMTATIEFDDEIDYGTLTVSVSDNSPQNATIVLNEKSRTNGVSVLYFDVEAQEGDVKLKDIEVEFSVDGAVTDTVAKTVNRARLYAGNTLLSSKAVGSDIVKFNNLSYTVSEDDVRTFRVEVDFERGDSLGEDPIDFTVEKVTVSGEDADFGDASDDVEVDETHTLIVKGIVAEIDSKPAPVITNDGKNVKFTFVFDITAYGETFFFGDDEDAIVAGALEGTADATIDSIIITSNAQLTNDGSYRITKGQTRSVTVEVFVTSADNGSVRVVLDQFVYDTESTLDGDEGTAKLGLPDFRSAAVNIVN